MRIHAICAYNGASYSGWQKQIGFISIQGEIEKALTKILASETTIQGSGRTDAGVHAINQHFHFEVNKENLDLDKFLYSLNCVLPSDIVVKSLEVVDSNWHSRFNAKKKKYIYKILNKKKDPFELSRVWLNDKKIDFVKLNEALSLYKGKHCFKCFTSKEEDEENYFRRIYKAHAKQKGEMIEITFVGDGFMRYEIRFLVGTAVAYSLDQIDLDYIVNHLKDDAIRDIVKYKAPSDGLYLAEVFYK